MIRGGIQSDGFIARINAAGSNRIYASYLGGTGRDLANGLAVDADLNAYVTGETESDDFPTTQPAGFTEPFQTNRAGGRDAFVVKLDSTGAGVYSTYLGGTLFDEGFGIAVGPIGRACVVGSTASADFPVEKPLQATRAGAFGRDAFVITLGPNGVALAFSTYFGGASGDEFANAVAIDSAGAIYFAGSTESSNDDLPLERPLQNAFAGGDSDGFIAKIRFVVPTAAPALPPAGLALLASLLLAGGGLWLRRSMT